MKSLLHSAFKLASSALAAASVVFASQSPSKAADQYGFPNLNGKVVKFELWNGVRINLPAARAIDNYQLNSYVPDNTDDWKFKVIDNGYGVMFTRLNTNKAITVSTLNVVDRTTVVAYEQQGNGRWIDWNPEHVGNGYYLIHLRYNPNQCLNVPGSASNVWVTTWTCNRNDRDQLFKIEEVTSAVSNLETFQYTALPNLYEAWIVSRKYKKPSFSLSNAGHAFTAIIKKERRKVTKYIGGVYAGDFTQEGDWKVWHTYGYWPGGLKVDNGCSTGDKETECQDVKDILSGISISDRGQAVRKARISESRANWIDVNRNVVGCTNYFVVGTNTDNKNLYSCNCVTHAAGQWNQITSGWDNFKQQGLFDYAPDILVDQINNQNQVTGNQFLDGGKTWQ
jgi:hypothetical protein